MLSTELDADLVACNPEIVTTILLQETLAATRRALCIANPQLQDVDFPIRDAEHHERLAFILLLQLADVDALLEQYHSAIDSHWNAQQLCLPF